MSVGAWCLRLFHDIYEFISNQDTFTIKEKLTGLPIYFVQNGSVVLYSLLITLEGN